MPEVGLEAIRDFCRAEIVVLKACLGDLERAQDGAQAAGVGGLSAGSRRSSSDSVRTLGCVVYRAHAGNHGFTTCGTLLPYTS